jgi:hypothetical protein
MRNQALKIHVDESDWKRTVKIDVKDMSSTNFNLGNEDKQFLIEQGISASKQFLMQTFPETSELLDNINDRIVSPVSSPSISISSILSDHGSIRKKAKKISFRRSSRSGSDKLGDIAQLPIDTLQLIQEDYNSDGGGVMRIRRRIKVKRSKDKVSDIHE